MNTFDYLSVLFSVILGLAVTEILQGFRRLIVAREKIHFYPPQAIWMGVVLLVVVQDWWAMFQMHYLHAWTFSMYGSVILLVTLLYLVAGICTPESEPDGSIDMEHSFFAHSRWMFALFCAAAVASVLKSIITLGGPPPRGDLIFHGLFFGGAVIGAITKSRWYHGLFAPAMALIFVAYIALYFTRL